LQLHGDVRILTLPYEHIPGELRELCDSSVTKMYSKNGHLQHIDVLDQYQYLAPICASDAARSSSSAISDVARINR